MDFFSKYMPRIEALCKKYKVKELFAFGSVNTEKFTNKSDIDLLIEFQPDITIEEYTDNYFFLRGELASLLGKEIDLVTKRSLSNPFFIQDIEQTKHLLYGV